MRYTLVEYMPEQYRASHIAAGNDGVWPMNGAQRVYIEGDIADRDLHPRWASVIEDGIRENELPEDAIKICASELDADAWRPYTEQE